MPDIPSRPARFELEGSDRSVRRWFRESPVRAEIALCSSYMALSVSRMQGVGLERSYPGHPTEPIVVSVPQDRGRHVKGALGGIHDQGAARPIPLFPQRSYTPIFVTRNGSDDE
jgi:hypothetical protein